MPSPIIADDAPAQLEFATDEHGKANQFVLRQASFESTVNHVK